MSEAASPARPVGAFPRLPLWGLAVAWVAAIVALLPLFLAASWAGSEVANYQVTTFESAARRALKAGDYDAAMKYCNGAMKTGHNQSEHWGRVYTLRALAYMGEGTMKRAAREVVLAGDFFSRRYYFAEEQDRQEVPQVADALGRRLLRDGNAPLALKVFSAGILASAQPVQALHALSEALSPEERSALWGTGEPRILINAFLDAKENGPRQVVNEQRRAVGPVRLEQNGVLNIPDVASLDLGPSEQEGVCWLGIPVYLPLDARPFGIRVRVKEEPALAAKVQLGYWFESPQKSATTEDPAELDAEGGWKVCDIRRDFLIERANEALRNGYSPEGGVINSISLSVPPGEASAVSFGVAELYLPKG